MSQHPAASAPAPLGFAPLDIAIIGAGIGGLAAAALCAKSGHRITLVERFATPRPLGSGLVLQPVGLAVLDAIGADPRGLGAPIARMLGHAGTRRVLDVSYRAEAPGLAIHRASLFAVLWAAATAAGISLQTGAACIAAPLRNGKRQILRDGADPLGPFDLVIDASGAGSTLSPMQARPLGYGAVWGSVPWPDDTDLPRDQLSQRYHAARHMAGVLPIGQLPGNPAPHAAIFWSLPRAGLDDWPRQNLDHWKAEVRKLWPQMAPFLTSLHSPADLTPARYTHGTLRRPYAEALAFIGDSAHRASPQLGQGANMALLDAFALAHALRCLPLDQALPRYAQMRRWHVRTYQTMSAAFTPMYQSGSRALPALRDHLLAPMAVVWPINHMLTALVSGDLLPPIAGLDWPQGSGHPAPAP